MAHQVEAGDFASYVHARYRALTRTAYLLTGSTPAAEDLVQSALARVLPRWDRLRADGNIDGYVHRVLVTTHLSWWRRAVRRESPVAAVPDRPGPDAGDALVDRAVLLAALRQLPAGQRAAVVLRYFDDLTEAQTAAALGCSLGTVKSRTSRGLATLRTLLGPLDDSAPTLEVARERA